MTVDVIVNNIHYAGDTAVEYIEDFTPFYNRIDEESVRIGLKITVQKQS